MPDPAPRFPRRFALRGRPTLLALGALWLSLWPVPGSAALNLASSAVGAAPLATLPELSPLPAAPARTLPELTPLKPTRPVPTGPAPQFTPVQTPPAQLPAAQTSLNLPRDPLYPAQWDLQSIDMPGAWAQFPAGRVGGAVTVAVLDTGKVDSPEWRGRLVGGYDFVHDPARAGDGTGRDPDPSGVGEFAYHGEVVSNLIAAAHDGAGMAGINPQARLLEVRVAGTDGLIDPQDLVDGLRWAAGLSVPGVPVNRTPARVANLSLYADFIPLTGCDARIQKAIDEVTARGMLVVAGAGNDGQDASGYSPAGCRNVLSVTSVTLSGTRPGYANWGRTVSLAAPGGEPGHGLVVSSVAGGVPRDLNGTSFAAPHVAGVASLLLGVRPRLSVAQVRDLLTRTATPFPGGRCDPDLRKTCGRGLLNASAALKAALASSVGK